MTISDSINVVKAFESIVGKSFMRSNRHSPLYVHDLSIESDRVDEVYLIIKKLKRTYSRGYFRRTINRADARIEKAYVSEDMDGFVRNVKGLMQKLSRD